MNHRIGLYNAFLIKENYIAARIPYHKLIDRIRQKVEVESLEELQKTFAANASILC